jgi:hypothetical protein
LHGNDLIDRKIVLAVWNFSSQKQINKIYNLWPENYIIIKNIL